jgi:hypothetical protein
MFKFYFLDDDIEHNTSFHSNTLYYDNLSIFLFTFWHFATQIFPIDELLKPYHSIIEN